MILQFEDKDSSQPKLFHQGHFSNSSGFRGCEQNNIILHFDELFDHYPVFECFSRARQNLIIVVSKRVLEGDHPVPKAIKEILKHEDKCERDTCKENLWYKWKVANVEYIGDKETNETQKDMKGSCCCCYIS